MIWLMWILKNTSDKVLRDKAFNIAKNPKNDGYQCSLALMVYKFIDKKSNCSAITCADKSSIKSEIMSNQQSVVHLADKLKKPIIKKFENHKIY